MSTYRYASSSTSSWEENKIEELETTISDNENTINRLRSRISNIEGRNSTLEEELKSTKESLVKEQKLSKQQKQQKEKAEAELKEENTQKLKVQSELKQVQAKLIEISSESDRKSRWIKELDTELVNLSKSAKERQAESERNYRYQREEYEKKLAMKDDEMQQLQRQRTQREEEFRYFFEERNRTFDLQIEDKEKEFKEQLVEKEDIFNYNLEKQQEETKKLQDELSRILIVHNWINMLKERVDEETNSSPSLPVEIQMIRKIRISETSLLQCDRNLLKTVKDNEDSDTISNLTINRDLLRTELLRSYSEFSSLLKIVEQVEIRRKMLKFYESEFSKYLTNNPSNIPSLMDDATMKYQALSKICSKMSEKEKLVEQYQHLYASCKEQQKSKAKLELEKNFETDRKTIERLNQDIKNIEPAIKILETKMESLQEKAMELKNDFPEIVIAIESINTRGFVSTDNMMVRFKKWAHINGIYSSNTLNDYENLEIIHNGITKVYTAMKNNKKIVLKCFTIDSDATYDAVVKNEITNMLSLSPHDRIAKINGVFCDPERREIFIEMPYYSKGNLRQYLFSLREKIKKDPSQLIACREILRKLLRMIVETIQYILFRKVIHRDIKMENILISDNETIVMADFGSSKKIFTNISHGTMTAGIIVGTKNYQAPEILLENRAPNDKSDIWSVGVVMLESWSIIEGNFDDNPNSYFNSAIVSYDENRKVVLPSLISSNDIQGRLLMELLNRIFNASTPEDRPSAQELITEEDYFTKGGELITDLIQEIGISLSFEQRIQKWISNLKLLKKKFKTSRSQTVQLRRDCILSDVSKFLQSVISNSTSPNMESYERVYQSTCVKFEQESGIDQGALSNEMYTKYLEGCFKESKLFMSQSDNQVENFIPSQVDISNNELEQEFLIGLGYMLKKIILDCDEKSVYIPFNDLVFKYMIEMAKEVPQSSTSSIGFDNNSNHYTFGKYDKPIKEQIRFWKLFIEQYDSSFLNNLLSLKRLTCSELQAVTCEQTFTFEQYDTSSGQLVENTMELNTENVDFYILQQMRDQVFSKSQQFKLSLISQGFNKFSISRMRRISSVSERLTSQSDWFDESKLSVVEIKLLLSGTSYIDSTILMNQMDFSELSESSQENMTMLITSLSKTQLREFLIWMTSLSSIPLKGLPKKIKLRNSNRFFAHACSTVLNFEVNNIEDYETFRDQFLKLLNNVSFSTQEE